MIGVESGCRSVTQLTGNGSGRLGGIGGSAVGLQPRMDRCNLDRIKHGGGVGATCKIALSRGGTHTRLCVCVSPSSRDYHRADMVPIRREEETSVVSHQTGRVESSR